MKKLNSYIIAIFILSYVANSTAQIIVNGEERFGNEWINYNQEYFKFEVSEDGLYRISKSALSNAGFPVNTTPMSDFQMFWLGDEVAIYTTTDGIMGDNDFIEFYGKKLRTELDRHLFEDENFILNREVSLYSNESVYFLTTSIGSHQRVEAIENNLTGSLPSSEEWYWHEDIYVLEESWVKAYSIPIPNGGSEIQYSKFESGEGFGTSLSDGINDFDLQATNAYNNGQEGTLIYRLTGNWSRSNHEITISWNDQQKNVLNFNRNAVVSDTLKINFNEIQATNKLKIRSQIVQSGETNDRNSIGELKFLYPRSYTVGNESIFKFKLPQSSVAKLIEIENFNHANFKPILYSIDRSQRFIGEIESNKVKFLLPNTIELESFILYAESKISSINLLSNSKFTDLRSSSSDYVIISNKKLYNNANEINQVEEYASYRSSSIGGGYNTQVIEISELADQFSYGINPSPFSIKNFSNYAKTNWRNLEYVFLIGKSIKYSELKNSDSNKENNLLPSFGAPSSDNFLFSEGHTISPNFSIGRLSAHNGNHLAIYLNKVKTYDSKFMSGAQTIREKAWLKRILHTTGGKGDAEKNNLKNRLEEMGQKAIEGIMGAEVHSYHSISDESIEEVPESSQAFELLNEGVIMKTYFGHGSSETIQLNLFEDPSNLTNTDRYPVMSAFGCYTGDAFGQNSTSLGEKNVLADRKGGVMYIATSGLGYISQLNKYGQDWYDRISNNLYGQPVGLAVKESIKFLESGGISGISRLLPEQLITQGDPAIQIANFPGPDYTIDYSSVSINPNVVNLKDPSFELKFTVFNLGRNPQPRDSLDYRIIQQLPDGSQSTPLIIRDLAPRFNRDIIINVPNQGDKSLGLNKLLITIDPDQKIAELPNPAAEDNNELISDFGVIGFDFFIIDGGVRAIYPQEFAIVNSDQTPLTASTLDPLAAEQKFIFELDTTKLFNSTSKRTHSLTQSGGVLKWIPGKLIPETIYYWRISPDSTSINGGFAWSESSFTYLPASSEGWNQGHYFQYLENDLDSMRLTTFRDLEYLLNPLDQNLRFDLDTMAPWLNVNGQAWRSINPEGPDAYLAIHNRHPVLYSTPNSSGTEFGSDLIIPKGDIFAYEMDDANDHKNIGDLLESFPAKTRVFIYTVLKNSDFSLHTENWQQDSISTGTNIISILESYGAKKIRLMESKGTLPYLFVFEKGKGVIYEDIGNSLDDKVTADVQAELFTHEGSLRSTVIGPSTSWKDVSWSLSNKEESDSVSLSLYGIDPDGQYSPVLFTTNEPGKFDISEHSASSYPFMQLIYYSHDAINKSIPQLEHWRINYSGLPDAAVNPSGSYSFKSDTLDQGQLLDLKLQALNITNINMDSLRVKYTITNLSTNGVETINNINQPLSGNSSQELTFNTNTQNLLGSYSLTVDVNPRPGQQEFNYFNNLLVIPFHVIGDKINPVLDVTFDGVHILNGDIVSSEALIQIRLDDENEHFLLDDTTLFKLSYTLPSGSLQPINFSEEQVSFNPSTESNNNRATIELSHSFLESGIYTLNVQAQDKAGNQSGDIAYRINFEVILESSISNVINYPNPFSTSTRFVYTLTGNRPPDFYKIQIMSVSGHIVRELTQDDIGPLKVGRHTTEYSWNGTDEYGDILANGIYLYKFKHENTDGSTFIKRDTNLDSLFKDEFGKMVILR